MLHGWAYKGMPRMGCESPKAREILKSFHKNLGNIAILKEKFIFLIILNEKLSENF